MSVLEELNGLIATWHLRGKEGGYITVQAARKWAQEVRDLQQQIAEFAEDWKTNFEQYEAQIRQLREELDRLQIANAQLQQQLTLLRAALVEAEQSFSDGQDREMGLMTELRLARQQLAIAEIGEDPLREM